MALSKLNYKSKKRRMNPVTVITCIVLFIYSFSLIFMLGWGLITSLKSASEFSLRPLSMGGPNIFGLPDVEFSKKAAEIDGEEYSLFANYRYIIKSFVSLTNPQSYYSIFGEVNHPSQEKDIIDCFLNSFFYAGTGGILLAFTPMIPAFLCSKYKYKFSKFLYTLLLVVMTVPIVGSQASTVKFLKDVGLFDTYASMVIMNINFTGLYFFVFYAFFQGLSNTYIEAAEIDGASQLSTLIRIVIPLSSKILVSVFIIQFIALWNSYELPMLYYPSIPTIAYSVYHMSYTTSGEGIGFNTQSTPQRIAGCMILAIPSLIVFLALKNIIMGNITMGGIKE